MDRKILADLAVRDADAFAKLTQIAAAALAKDEAEKQTSAVAS